MSSPIDLVSAILYCVPSFVCMIAIPWLHFTRKKRPGGYKGATFLSKAARAYNATLQFTSILGMTLFLIAPAGDSLGNNIITFLGGTGNEILVLLLYLNDLEIMEFFSSLDSRITEPVLMRVKVAYCLFMFVPIFFSAYRSYFFLINDVNTFNHLRLPNVVILALADVVSIGLDWAQNVFMLRKLREFCRFAKKDLAPFVLTARVIQACLLLDLLGIFVYMLQYYLASSGKLVQLNANGMLVMITGLVGLHCVLQIILIKRLVLHVLQKPVESVMQTLNPSASINPNESR